MEEGLVLSLADVGVLVAVAKHAVDQLRNLSRGGLDRDGSGLAAGERVIVEPPTDLVDGARVKEVKP